MISMPTSFWMRKLRFEDFFCLSHCGIVSGPSVEPAVKYADAVFTVIVLMLLILCHANSDWEVVNTAFSEQA